MENTQRSVLHIITRLVKGGADENTLHTVYGLIKNGYEVDLLLGGDSDQKLIAEHSKLNIILMPELKRDIKPSNILAFWKIYRLIKRKNYHLVHTHTAMAGFIGRIAARIAKTPVIIHTLHGTTFHDHMNVLKRNLYKSLEVFAGRYTDFFITVGDDIKEKYLAVPIGTREKYKTIRSGFEYDKFNKAFVQTDEIQNNFRIEFNLNKNAVLIGMISRLEPRKGHTYLIQAAKKIIAIHPESVFVIVGEGYYRNEIQNEIKEYGFEKRFIFTGHRQDIEQVIAAMNIIVLTSLWEGLPRVLVQAALLNKPIVSFEVEGAWEVIENNVNGFIVPSKDTAQFAEKVNYLLENLEDSNRMGKNGRNYVNKQWDKEVMVQQIIEIYDKQKNKLR